MLLLRLILESDFRITCEWAKNETLRQFSFTKSISEEEHQTWFYKKINDPHSFFFIAELDGKPCGLIRFDIKNNEAIISYLVDPIFQGKGLGKVILEKGLTEMLSFKDSGKIKINKFIGFVMKENYPSVKSFERLGFIKTENSDKYKFVKLI